ncbi:MAG: tRNA (adenosine(37)-N6)-threonylcarbamoyltransferase complex dimerization subunit type 1 TsaB [Betaproteobacteria bacterium]|nr:tRNA (adenosine(37)-N6)-threonylcarbamoyltransferase complex dimerization subunit type 1 TsaB [Betaproteobacteria bacterium]
MVLALGTSGAWCSVALRWSASRDEPGAARRAACVSEVVGNAHAERVMPMARELLAQAGLDLRDVGLIAFDAGPGSFTGLRVGCGLAQGLALGLSCPVVPVSSLLALAWPSRQWPTLAATDARMGEVYHGVWRRADSERGPPDRPLVVQAPQELERFIAAFAEQAGGPWIAVGDAFARHPGLAEQAVAAGARVIPDAFPAADALAEIGEGAWLRGESIAPDAAAPLYVRDKVALDTAEQAAARQRRGSLA